VRLIGDRASDRLPDPPRRPRRSRLVAARLSNCPPHFSADVAFLDQVEELQAAFRIFFGDRDDEASDWLHHSFLAWRRLALALLHHHDDLAELQDLEAGLAGQLMICSQVLDAILVAATRFFQPLS